MKYYTDSELLEEVTDLVETIGGSIECMHLGKNLFKLTVDEDVKAYAHSLVVSIVENYKVERMRLLREYPFVRIKYLKDDMGV